MEITLTGLLISGMFLFWIVGSAFMTGAIFYILWKNK